MNQRLSPDPLWYKDAIIYELHIKAFFDTDDDGVGDFQGLIRKLDYLQDLGVNCIWLLPFYPSPLRDDGYDIAEYYDVHPSYGTLDDARQFVEEAHRRDIRVITELVINHTSDQHPWFQRARRAPAGSPERNFYVWSDTDDEYSEARIIFLDTESSNWTWDDEAGAYFWHRFFHHQPDLNYDNPAVLEAVLDVMKFWLDIGVDGLRLDAIPYLVEREDTNCENLPETHVILKRFRQELDAHYQERIFLAEANQWPADVRPYFGNGDECHMAFHFPLMPRIFMALRQEDRHPIVEIMRQTPSIPPSCQWALFLRNHDELTLEMVTAEERDYMYNEYAADPQARLNLGIRRRLAPLLENSRDRIQLLMGLLFSFPGTPVLYYGDEIGMGDNVYLGDRDGVRTPMQWTSDRNAGFSRADFARLYLPPIMDPVYGYQAVNVEAEQRSPSSLLNWTKLLIALRKRFKAFGRGTFAFLRSENRKVLTYLRRYEDETILCVANLSRYVQPVELDLSEFEGYTPVELFGRVHFPRIGELPYFLTLGPHSFYWFQLEYQPEDITTSPAQAAAEQPDSLPLIALSSRWSTLMEGKYRAEMERTVLPAFLRRQPWLERGPRQIETVSIRDWVCLGMRPAPLFWIVIEVFFNDGPSERFSLPIQITVGENAAFWMHDNAAWLLCRVRSTEGEGVLHDALADDQAVSRVLAFIRENGQLRMHAGQLRAAALPAFDALVGDEDLTSIQPARGAVEGNESALVLTRRLMFRMYHHLLPDLHPDFELTRHLTETLQLERVPRFAGTIEYVDSHGDASLVSALQQRLPNQGTAWQHAVTEISRFLDDVQSRQEGVALEFPRREVLLCGRGPEPAAGLRELLGTVLQAAELLGRRTAQLHAALGTSLGEEAFRSEPWTASDSQRLVSQLRAEITRARKALMQNRECVPEPWRDQADDAIVACRVWADVLDRSTDPQQAGRKIRCHGDYHLGNLLWSENDFYFTNFSGDVTQPADRRRSKQTPLLDVANLLCSLGLAAHGVLLQRTDYGREDFPQLQPWVQAWIQWSSWAFLRAYRRTESEMDHEAGPLTPQQDGVFADLLRVLVARTSLRNLEHELCTQRGWVPIPILQILGQIETDQPLF